MKNCIFLLWTLGLICGFPVTWSVSAVSDLGIVKWSRAINSVTAGEEHVVVTGPNTESWMDGPKNKWGHNFMTMPVETCAVWTGMIVLKFSEM
jgi:hypothetical protein